jgi:glycosyltransferase involved in cell wall biosynthesis
MKVSILIAVYNEASTVATLLDRVWAQQIPGSGREIIIVESNSSDGSRQIVADFAAAHAAQTSTRVEVIYQDQPRGKGHAIRQAFAAATGDILLIQDADLEYDVADYPDLLEPIIQGRSAFVLGSRHLGPSRWKIRKFARSGFLSGLMNVGGILFHAFFNVLFSTRLTDPTTMYKVFRAQCIDGLTFECDRFDFDFELLGKLIRSGFTPIEVPVSYRSRGFHEGKKIRVLRDPFTWIAAILKSRFARLCSAERSANGRRGPGAAPANVSPSASSTAGE